MQNNLRDKHMDQLFQAILKLEDLDQCYALFSDLCTVTELLSMKQRFWVARLLKELHPWAPYIRRLRRTS